MHTILNAGGNSRVYIGDAVHNIVYISNAACNCVKFICNLNLVHSYVVYYC